MTLAEFQRRLAAVGAREVTIDVDPHGNALVRCGTNVAVVYAAHAEPGESLATAAEVFLRGLELRARPR